MPLPVSPLPAAVDAALGALRELTAQVLAPGERASRLRAEVLLPLAQAYQGTLRADQAARAEWDAAPGLLPYHHRATMVAARACLLILGNGKETLTPDMLREVLRLGESFCDLHGIAQRRLDPTDVDRAARVAYLQLQATLGMVGADATLDGHAAERARARFQALGDERAVSNCDDLIARIASTHAHANAPGAGGASGTGGVSDPFAEPPAGTPSPVARPAASTAALAMMPPAPPDLRPISPTVQIPGLAQTLAQPGPDGRARTNRSAEGARPTVQLQVWPPARNATHHLVATAAVSVTLALGAAASLTLARRAVQAHRQARAAEETPAPASVTAAPRHAPTPAPPAATQDFAIPLPASMTQPATAEPAPQPATRTVRPGAALDLSGDAVPAPRVPIEIADETPREAARRWNAEGFRAYEAGDRALALTDYTQATKLDSTLPLPWYNLACIQALEGHAEAAVDALRHFHALDATVDLRQRVQTDKDFERVRDQPAFKQAVAGMMR